MRMIFSKKNTLVILSMMIVCVILGNLTIWLMHTRAINRFIRTIQEDFADYHVSMSYDLLKFSKLTAWKLEGELSNVKLAFVSDLATYRVKVGNVKLTSDLVHGRVVVTFPRAIKSLLRVGNLGHMGYVINSASKHAILFRFLGEKAHILEFDLHYKLFSWGRKRDLGLSKLLYEGEQNNLIVKIDKEELLHVEGLGFALTDISAGGENWSLSLFIPSLILNLNHPCFRQEGEVLSNKEILGNISLKLLLDRMSNTSKLESSERNSNGKTGSSRIVNYNVKAFNISSDSSGIEAKGVFDVFGDDLSSLNFKCRVGKYSAFVDLYADIWSAAIRRVPGVPANFRISDNDIIAVKSLIHDHFETKGDDLFFDIVQTKPEAETRISGFTIQNILEMLEVATANNIKGTALVNGK